MDQIVRTYAVDHFPPTLNDIIANTFNLFDSFNLLGYKDDFINLLMQQSYMSPADVSDAYMGLLINKQNYILEQHHITLVEDATLEQRNEILTGLDLLRDLHSYDEIIYILESFDTNEEKLVAILTLLCNMDDATIFSLIESVDAITLDTLKEFIYNRTKDTTDPIIHHNIRNIKLFRSFVGHDHYLAKQMTASNVPLGLPVKVYIPIISGALLDRTINDLALDVYSLLMITNSTDSPVMQFKSCSQLLFTDIRTISDVSASLIKIDLAFNKYLLELTHEKE